MSYETLIKKLQQIWEASQKNQITMEVTRQALLTSGAQQAQLPPRILDFNALASQGGGYQDAAILVDQLSGTEGDAVYIGVVWSIVINNIPEYYLPFVRVGIAYNTQDAIDPTTIMNYSYFDSVVYPPSVDQFGNPTGANQNVVQATFSAAFSYQTDQNNPDETQTPDMQVQLYLVLINPNKFV